MSNDLNSQETVTPHKAPEDHAAGTKVTAYAAVARRERAAALRALAAHFAHQVRNQLAATRAVCDNLRVELENTDHQQRLNLALNEIDRLLDSVSSTVQSLVETPEPAQPLDAVGEVQEAIQIFISGHEEGTGIELIGEPIRCALPPMGFRVAIYSLLDHIVHASAPATARIEVQQRDNKLQIGFSACSERASELVVAKNLWPMEWSAGSGHMGLLVAERFARDLGGRLAHSVTGGCLTLTLELPLQTCEE